MTTPARPGSFTGATDNASSGGLFTDTLIDGIPDIVGADVAAAQAAATAAAASEANASTSETNAATSATTASTAATNAANSATAAANSATSAATSASTTAADAATATAQAAAASTSATNAAASQTAASNSATSAATSATQATASLNTALASASSASNSATAAATSATNAATSETNAATSETNAATSATSSANSATASATSATASATSASNAATSETNAATSETNAAASAAAALVSETNAAASETTVAADAAAAATSASNASTSETNAAASAVAALASETAAAGYVDEFDDRYLGSKTSDPTLDNDGNALTDGALYYNTTVDRMKVYDLSTTSWLFISPTAAEQINIDAVANDITNVNTVATNLTDINSFADTYFIAATAPSSPTLGDLWFDTSSDTLKFYSASGWQNAVSSVNGTSQRVTYIATSGQTTFAATYDVGYVDVYLNGIKLIVGTDFTATNGTSIVLASGATLNDTVNIVAYGTFNIAIPDISGDATPELGGDLSTNGHDINFSDNDKAIFGAGSDLQIYHDGGSSWVSDVGAGNLKLTSDGAGVFLQKGATEFMGEFLTDGAVRLYYDNAAKFETTATGVDVTGTVTADGLELNGSNNALLAMRTTGDTDSQVMGTQYLNNSGAVTAQTFATGNSTSSSVFRIKAIGAIDLIGGDIGVTGAAPDLRIDSSGNVGIGTVPLAKLHVDSTNSAFYVGYGGNEDIYLQTTNGNVLFTDKGATSERMRIASNGLITFNNAAGSTETASKTGSVTPDLTTYQNFAWTLTGNITLSNPSTEVVGMSGVFIFIHSGAARTVSLGTDYKTAGAAGLTLSSAAGAVDIVPYFVQSTSNILLGTPLLAFS